MQTEGFTTTPSLVPAVDTITLRQSARQTKTKIKIKTRRPQPEQVATNIASHPIFSLASNFKLNACLLVQHTRCATLPRFSSRPGSSSSFKNTWTGWYSAGSHILGSGKRPAYDNLPISNIRLSDGSGRFVDYKLNKGYAGRTLLSIVQGCMGSNRRNEGGSRWNNGLCNNVGKLTSYSGSFTGGSLSSVLRIGVGNGGSDTNDWALLMPLNGNANGDYNGNNVWAFGIEDETNNGYSGTVTISTCSGALFSFRWDASTPPVMYHSVLHLSAC